jgi:multidrug efflux pump subunit AcrB
MKVALDHLLMRNTLILIEQIKNNKDDGLDDYHAVVEATVQRARPVVLTAMAAVLAFIPLTTSVSGARWLTPSSGVQPSARF